jgi:glycosidase
MLEVAKFWMARGVDGFRCDAAWGVPHSFWKSLRKELKIFNTEFLLIDEVLPRHPSFHDFEFDASYDTDFYGNLLDLFNGRKSLKGFVYGVKKTKFNYPGETIDLRYIENHDMPRMIKQFGKERAMLAGALLLLSPGMPLIYYGQEIGMKETRPLMDWSAVKNENEFIGLYRELINFRKNIELGAKDKDVIYTVVNDNLLKIENSRYLAVFNFDDSPKIIDGFHKKPLLGRNYESRSDGEIVLKKYGFIARNKK